jgi:hypothetical protein
MRTMTSVGKIVAVTIPRYRCTACGNLTRFDVTSTKRTSAFHHYSVGGELSIENEEVLEETIELVSCQWCSSDRSVVTLTAAEAEAVDAAGGTA